MREIRFRGKTLSGKWVYGYYLHDGQRGRYVITDGLLDIDAVKPETVGQFTGLHDKNGKDIYEGDIVEIPRTPEHKQKRVITRHIVTCESVCNWAFQSLTKEVLTLMMANHSDFDSYRFEVIGNIHDNPELNKTTSLNLPARKPRQKPGIQVEFVVKDNPKSEPYVEHLGKRSSKVVFEVTQEQMNKAMDKVIEKEGV